MSELEALARRFYGDVMSKGDLAALDELVADDFVDHEEVPGMPSGKEGVAELVKAFRAAFPDLRVDVEGLGVAGDEVWVYAVMRGTHRGEFMGVAATDRTVEVPFMDRVRVRDDKAVEHWGVTDMMGLMQQLGVLPE